MDSHSQRTPQQRGPAGRSIFRLRIIDELLGQGQFYTTADILHKLEIRLPEKDTVSLRQVQKDLVLLEELCSQANPDAPEIYEFDGSGRRRRYVAGVSLFSKRLTRNERVLLGCLLPMIGPISGEETLSQLRTLKRHSLSTEEEFSAVDIGIRAPEGEAFATLFIAINDKEAVELSYHTFTDPTSRGITVYPRLLKQYNGRWYLLCNASHNGYALTFRLDQIDVAERLKPSAQRRLRAENPEAENSTVPRDLLRFMTGVSFPADRERNRDLIEEVVFWVSDRSYNYFVTNPIIEDEWDEVIDDGDLRQQFPHLKEGRFMTMYCIINFEFKQRLMSFMDTLVVISPAWLRDEFHRRTALMFHNYHNPEK